MEPDFRINTQRGLKDLTDKVDLAVRTAVKQRRNLGLSVPERFDVNLFYYNSQDTNARAIIDSSVPTIELNLIPLVSKKLNDNYRFRVKDVIGYFDIGRIFLNEYSEEENILRMLDEPKEVVDAIEFSLAPKELKILKKRFKHNGTKYSVFRRIAIENARPVKSVLGNVRPVLKQEFRKLPLSSMCISHELDHLSYSNSIMDKRYHNLVDRIDELEDQGFLKKHPKLYGKLLESISENIVLAEIRAYFFDCFNHRKLNFKKVKRQVYDMFHNCYIDTVMPHDIIDALIKKELGSSGINKDTMNYLKKVVSEQYGNLVASLKYRGYKDEKINYRIINRLKFEELPKWQKKISDNAIIATEVMGDAFKQNPSIFNKADQEAKTFGQYLDILNAA